MKRKVLEILIQQSDVFYPILLKSKFKLRNSQTSEALEKVKLTQTRKLTRLVR